MVRYDPEFIRKIFEDLTPSKVHSSEEIKLMQTTTVLSPKDNKNLTFSNLERKSLCSLLKKLLVHCRPTRDWDVGNNYDGELNKNDYSRYELDNSLLIPRSVFCKFLLITGLVTQSKHNHDEGSQHKPTDNHIPQGQSEGGANVQEVSTTISTDTKSNDRLGQFFKKRKDNVTIKSKMFQFF